MIDRETLESEKADYEQQITAAQQQVGTWQQKALVAAGALQAVEALLAKLDAPAEAQDPETRPE
jgi:hypothetical protein